MVHEVDTKKGQSLKPYLFIDVDGVLNPSGMSYSARDKSGFEKYDILGYKVYLNRKHGKQLLALTDYYELVWATTW
jgi:hypothetical protein